MKKTIFGLLILAFVSLGCAEDSDNATLDGVEETASTTASGLPVFTLIWSEYPSWSAFDVAGAKGIINPKEGGEYSDLEKKHGVDIVLKRRDYVQSMKEFASSECDAVTVTNIDALNLAKGRPSTATMPTSTSAGADGILAVNAKSVEDLKGKVVYGPEDCVTEYLWVRGLDINKQNPQEYSFANMEPDAAAIALQTGDADSKVQAAGLWQPFLLQTQRTRPETNLIFDSTIIPLEVIDMVLVGNDSLEREGGEGFAKAVAEAYYELNKQLEDPKQTDVITEAIGKKFSRLPLEDMKEVLQKCKFFGNAADAHALFSSKDWQDKMSTTILDASVKTGIVREAEKPTIGYNDKNTQLNFSTEYLSVDDSDETVKE